MNDWDVQDIGTCVLDPSPVLSSRLVCPFDSSRCLVRPVNEVAKLRQTVRTNKTGNDDVPIAARGEVHRLYVAMVEVGPVQPTGVKVNHQSAHSTDVIQIGISVCTIQCRSFHASMAHPVTPVQIATSRHTHLLETAPVTPPPPARQHSTGELQPGKLLHTYSRQLIW